MVHEGDVTARPFIEILQDAEKHGVSDQGQEFETQPGEEARWLHGKDQGWVG